MIQITFEIKNTRFPKSKCENWYAKVMKLLSSAKASRLLKKYSGKLGKLDSKVLKKNLYLQFVSKSAIEKLNSAFRDKAKPTDILSFAPTDESEFGSLVICWDIAKRQAAQNNWSIQTEVEYLMLHGILHLLGFDHERSLKEHKRMMSFQDELFMTLKPKVRLELNV